MHDAGNMNTSDGLGGRRFAVVVVVESETDDERGAWEQVDRSNIPGICHIGDPCPVPIATEYETWGVMIDADDASVAVTPSVQPDMR